jgi:hypothetical protein
VGATEVAASSKIPKKPGASRIPKGVKSNAWKAALPRCVSGTVVYLNIISKSKGEFFFVIWFNSSKENAR